MDRPEPDLCIVGSGPAGLALAATLVGSGVSAVVVESGATTPSELGSELSDGDLRGFRYAGLDATRHRQVGGTTNIWNVEVEGAPGAKYVPLDRRDLRGWPIGWDELAPFYPVAQQICGLGPFSYEAAPWSTADRQPFDLAGTGLSSAVYQFGSNRPFTTELPERLALSDEISLLANTTAVGLLIDDSDGGVLGVKAIDPGGSPVEVKAGATILAAGAVENARLLLLAGHRSDWIGRGFMEHARDFSLSLEPAEAGLYSRASFYDLHEAGGHLIGGRIALSDEMLDAHGLPNASLTIFPRPDIDRSITGRLRRVLSGGPDTRTGPYGWSASEESKQYRDFKLILNLEQRPDPDNRVELSERLDRLGSHLPRLTLHWTDREQEDLDRHRVLVRDAFDTAGLGALRFQPGAPPDLNAHHHAGTTRMADAAADGVVDTNGQVFGMPRLYCAGASVFPTAGYANPMLTIVAMSVRLAEHLRTDAS